MWLLRLSYGEEGGWPSEPCRGIVIVGVMTQVYACDQIAQNKARARNEYLQK